MKYTVEYYMNAECQYNRNWLGIWNLELDYMPIWNNNNAIAMEWWCVNRKEQTIR